MAEEVKTDVTKTDVTKTDVVRDRRKARDIIKKESRLGHKRTSTVVKKNPTIRRRRSR